MGNHRTKEMGIGHQHQRILLLVALFISLVATAPGRNPNCQVDGSEEPVCDGSVIFFAHKSDCGKFWECGADLKPCLFECPPISEDIGGGTLYFNPEIAACDWPVNVDCQSEASTVDETSTTLGLSTTQGLSTTKRLSTDVTITTRVTTLTERSTTTEGTAMTE